MPSIAKTIKGILFGKGMRKAKFLGGPMKGMVAYFDFVRDTQTWRGIDAQFIIDTIRHEPRRNV